MKNVKVKGNGKNRINEVKRVFTEHLFLYVTPVNKEWVKSMSLKKRVSYSRLIHDMIQSAKSN